MIKSLIMFLNVFKDTTKILSSETYPTISNSVPTYNICMDAIDKFKEAHVQAGKSEQDVIYKAVKASFDVLFKYYSLCSQNLICFGTMLDPRLKAHYYRYIGWEERWTTDAIAAVCFHDAVSIVLLDFTGLLNTPRL